MSNSSLKTGATERLKSAVDRYLPESLARNVKLFGMGLFQIPLIAFIRPKIIEVDGKLAIKVPLCWRTKNHLGSMYFGVLAAGADLACGLLALETIEKSGKNVSLIFKDFKAEFLKRAEADTVFLCEDEEAARDLVKKAIETGDRVERRMPVVATVPSRFGSEPVARFELTLSLKLRK